MYNPRQRFLKTLLKSYESALTTVLGKQDSQGNFENILKYQENAQLALDALLKKLASDMNGDGDIFKNIAGETPEGYNYESYLLERGYLNYTATPGEYEITDLAIHEFDKMLNSPLEPGQAAQLLEDLATNMAASEYGTRWESMTPNAQAKAVAEYKEWFMIIKWDYTILLLVYLNMTNMVILFLILFMKLRLLERYQICLVLK